jgi:hypothetical protein
MTHPPRSDASLPPRREQGEAVLDLEAIAAMHYEDRDSAGVRCCRSCGDLWPCDIPLLIARVRALESVTAEMRDYFAYWATTPCIRALLGEDYDDCGCASCSARGILKQVDAAVTPEAA